VESYPAPAISYPGQAFSEIILPYLFYEKNQDSPHILGCPITRKLHDESLKARQDKPGMEVHAYNSSTQEAEAGKSQVPGQLGLHNHTYLKNQHLPKKKLPNLKDLLKGFCQWL
jgi:hypothetical protein